VIHIFLNSALAGGEWSVSRPCRFTPGERAPSTHWIGGWVDPRAGLDHLQKRTFLTLPGLELGALGRPARSKSLYRLSYPGFLSSIRLSTQGTTCSQRYFRRSLAAPYRYVLSCNVVNEMGSYLCLVFVVL
jgi:hypothetical protein